MTFEGHGSKRKSEEDIRRAKTQHIKRAVQKMQETWCTFSVVVAQEVKETFCNQMVAG